VSLSGTADSVADAIEIVGKAATLRRLSGRAGIWFDVTVIAVWSGSQPIEIVGGIVQVDREVKISDRAIAARKWPGPPRRGDQMILDGRTHQVLVVDSRSVGEETVMHIIQVRGGA
jgi:hypothetical protein